MLMDAWTDRCTDDGQNVINMTHPEHSSSELIINLLIAKFFIDIVVFATYFSQY